MLTANADYGLQVAKQYRADEIRAARQYHLGKATRQRREATARRIRLLHLVVRPTH